MKKWNRSDLVRWVVSCAAFCAVVALVLSIWLDIVYGNDEFGLGVGVASGSLYLQSGLHEFGQELIGWRIRWIGDAGPDWVWHPGYTRIYTYYVVTVPLWMLVLPSVGLAAWLWWVRWKQMTGRGGCVKCGYSRAGLADDARCPECGGELRAQAELKA